jgi:predicted transcriptional regulator
MKLFSSESGQILRQVIKFGVIIALVVLIVIEVGPLIWERFNVAQTAEDIADSVANTYYAYHDKAQVIKDTTDKLKMAGFSDDEIRQASVEFLPPDGSVQSIKVTVVKYANTLITKHISALKKLSRIAASHESGVLTPPPAK